MSGLVGYGSSDEGDDQREADEGSVVDAFTPNEDRYSKSQRSHGPFKVEGDYTKNRRSGLDIPTANGNLVGPSLSRMPASNIASAPHSPYSANRSLIHDLTLPTKANFDIPPSPPGFSPAGMDKKFEHFLDLKKQGVHFNEKLARSSALKNPSLLPKLMNFAGVEERDQYATTLPKDIWNPAGFPTWAYKEDLAKSQQDISQKREEMRSRLHRETIDFISGTNSGISSKGVMPAFDAGVKGPRESVAERVMAGLDRERTRSPMVDSNMRANPERRGGKTEGLQYRSNTRKRSRSR